MRMQWGGLGVPDEFGVHRAVGTLTRGCPYGIWGTQGHGGTPTRQSPSGYWGAQGRPRRPHLGGQEVPAGWGGLRDKGDSFPGGGGQRGRITERGGASNRAGHAGSCRPKARGLPGAVVPRRPAVPRGPGRHGGGAAALNPGLRR